MQYFTTLKCIESG
uniref:Uncharacterized protein n=1 Tax=Anguilla anguilla TaxID=7936 RepID=A0A0E9V4Z9_ANGAN